MADETVASDAGSKAEDREEGELEEGEISSDDPRPLTPSQRQPHPLEYSWTFWFDSPAAKAKQAAWGNSLRSIHTFSTVEEFWGLYNNIHNPSKLASGSDFYCFKHKIEPKWEDPVCANGGKWTITSNKGKIDALWLYTLLAMIGEQFDYSDEICGAVVNARGKHMKVSLWTKNASKQEAQVSIGRQWKEFLDHNDPIGFIFHEEAKKHDRGAKERYQA